MDRSSRQRISKEIVNLNTLDQIELADIYRAFHPTAAEYTFFDIGLRNGFLYMTPKAQATKAKINK